MGGTAPPLPSPQQHVQDRARLLLAGWLPGWLPGSAAKGVCALPTCLANLATSVQNW